VHVVSFISYFRQCTQLWVICVKRIIPEAEYIFVNSVKSFRCVCFGYGLFSWSGRARGMERMAEMDR